MKKITLSVDIRYHQLFRTTSRHHKVWSAPVLTVSDVSLTVITDPTEVKRALRKEVSKYVVFRGAIWKVCDEPMYGYMTFGCVGDGTHVFIADKGSYARMYNALDRERFLADAANVANARMDYKDAKEIKRTKIRIDVLKPELVTNPKACR